MFGPSLLKVFSFIIRAKAELHQMPLFHSVFLIPSSLEPLSDISSYTVDIRPFQTKRLHMLIVLILITIWSLIFPITSLW